MKDKTIYSDYGYHDSELTWSNYYIWPALRDYLAQNYIASRRVFEIGCGNGAMANLFYKEGYDVTGIDLSESGIKLANKTYPHLQLHLGDVYDDLANQYGRFPVVICSEVIAHCYSPFALLKTFHALLEDGGVGLITTPYHDYWKNLLIAVAGRCDDHYGPLWEGGIIKFFSPKTLNLLLKDSDFTTIRFIKVGRIPVFAKSMIAVVHKD